MKKQNGYVYPASGWWVLRFRETLVENGQRVRRQLAKKIAPIAPEHRRLKRPPPEIQQIAEALLQPLNNQSYTPEATERLSEFVEKVYFPGIAGEKRASTTMGYRNRWNSQLKARCGHLRLRDFRTCDGQKLLQDVARQNPELRRSTLHHLKSLLSAIFRVAIQQGYLDGLNPMREVSIPAAPSGEETRFYNLEEIQTMLAVLPEPARTLLALAGFTGLRRAELCGLQWEDYNGAEISVTRSVWEGHVNEPKTRKSKAPVPVIPSLRTILDRYRITRGNPQTGPIFANAKGKPANLNNVLCRVILPCLNRCVVCGKDKVAHIAVEHQYQRDARIPEWRGFHSFRRGLASNLYRLGVPDKVIQQILRHANVSTTMNIYVKTVSADSVAAMQRLDSALCVDCAQETTTEKQPLVN